MKVLYRTIVFALVAVVWGLGLAQVPAKPAQASPVVDLAGIIKNDSLVSALNAELDSLSKRTGTQIVIVTVGDLASKDANEFATELGREWGVGGKKKNNGLVIVVKPRTDNGAGEVGFATGYGLEGIFPDVFCKRLQSDYMVPHFKDGDYAGGIEAAVKEIVPVVLNDYNEKQALAAAADTKPAKKSGGGNGWFTLALVVLVIALVALWRRRRKSMAAGIAAASTVASHEPQASKPNDENIEKETTDSDNDTETEDNSDDDLEDDSEDDEPDKPQEPEPYKYGYGGGDFGGGGASTKF